MNKLSERFVSAAKHGDLDAVRGMLDATRKTGILGTISAELTGDAFNGQIDKYERNTALADAAIRGHSDVVEYLIPFSDPAYNSSIALRSAAEYGHADIVELLIPHSDPNAMEAQALRDAAKNGHFEVVEKLLPHSDPTEWSNGAIRDAATNGHMAIVDLLYDHSDVDEALHFVDKGSEDLPGVSYLRDRRRSEMEATVLQDETMSALFQGTSQDSPAPLQSEQGNAGFRAHPPTAAFDANTLDAAGSWSPGDLSGDHLIPKTQGECQAPVQRQARRL